MDIVKLLDDCKEKLGFTSDYALAKEFEVLPARVYGYRRGTEHPDTYVCFKIAEILEISPSKVIASVEAKTQKNPRKSLYFQQFFMIAGLWITLGLMLPSLGTTLGSAYADGIIKINHINHGLEWLHNGTLYEVIKKKIKAFLLKNERYFTCNWHVKFAAQTA